MNMEENKGKLIPIQIEKLLNFIEKYGRSIEGIFRIGGSLSDIQTLKILINHSMYFPFLVI